MNFESISLEPRGPQTGLSLYDKGKYIATYCSLNECILDLAYRFSVNELDKIVKAFCSAPNCTVNEPFEYRGVCSEMFWPTDTVFRYVYYRNTLSELFDCFSYHEEKAMKNDEIFTYGVQGTGIHRFNSTTKRYEFWVGGNLKTVSDIMKELKETGKGIPKVFAEEYERQDAIDVFISHKSQAYVTSKRVYDELRKAGINVFLSEVSLPAIADTDYTSSIDCALERTNGMIVVAESIDTFDSGWVHYEWSSFLNEKRSGRKKGNLITVVDSEKSIPKLPYALRQFESVPIHRIEQIIKYF